MIIKTFYNHIINDFKSTSSSTQHIVSWVSWQSIVALYLWKKVYVVIWSANNNMTTAMHGFNFISWLAARSNVSNMVRRELVLSRPRAAMPLPGACNCIECQRGRDVPSQWMCMDRWTEDLHWHPDGDRPWYLTLCWPDNKGAVHSAIIWRPAQQAVT